MGISWHSKRIVATLHALVQTLELNSQFCIELGIDSELAEWELK